jgi:hypothetical protein
MAVRSEDLGDTGTLKYPSRIKLQYTWHAGKVGSRFYEDLRDHCRIMGTKCARCDWVYVPPRETCPRCYGDIAGWVELPPTGTLLTYTVTRYAVPGIQPLEPPYALGIVKLDGAGSGLVHLLGEIEPERITTGMRVEAVFAEERTGRYLDIKYFRPVAP